MFEFSVMFKISIPKRIKNIVVIITILECRLMINFFRLIFDFINSLSSYITPKPNPPKIIRNVITKTVIKSFWNLIKLSEKIEKPALQNADIEWKIAYHKHFKEFWKYNFHFRKSNKAPKSSNENVKMNIYLTIVLTFMVPYFEIVSFRISLSEIESWFFKIRIIKVDKDIIPIPPSWIKSIIKILPKGEKYEPVSRTVSPVTQKAEVEVKRASMKLILEL